jgi:spore coat protein U-like protein
MLKHRLILFLITIWSFHTAGQSCQMNFSSSNFVSHIDNSTQSLAHSLNVRRSNNSINCRNIRVYFSRGNSNNYNRTAKNGSKIVPYNLYKESSLNNILKDFGDAGLNEYISYTIDEQNINYSFDFFIKVVDLDSVFANGPGYYNDLIEVKLYSEKNNGDLVYQTSTWINIQIIIPRYAEISLGSIGSSHDPSSTQHIMSFGTLSTGKVVQAALNVKSTVSFGVYMTSLNGSLLKNGSTSIPYKINVNNSGYRSLSNPGQSYYITQRNINDPVNFETIPIFAQVGVLPPNPDSGEYSDVITITVTPW